MLLWSWLSRSILVTPQVLSLPAILVLGGQTFGCGWLCGAFPPPLLRALGLLPSFGSSSAHPLPLLWQSWRLKIYGSLGLDVDGPGGYLSYYIHSCALGGFPPCVSFRFHSSSLCVRVLVQGLILGVGAFGATVCSCVSPHAGFFCFEERCYEVDSKIFGSCFSIQFGASSGTPF